jgi:hypothetical protein
MTLHELLDIHVRATKRVGKTLAPGEDFAPLLGAWRNDELVSTAVVVLPPDRTARHAQHAVAMNFLREQQATAYTMVIAMWMSGKVLTRNELTEWLASEKNVSDRDDRIDAVVCVAGDKEQTLTVEFEVIRSQSGRILHLRKIEKPPGVTMGLFLDLLIESPARVN